MLLKKSKHDQVVFGNYVVIPETEKVGSAKEPTTLEHNPLI